METSAAHGSADFKDQSGTPVREDAGEMPDRFISPTHEDGGVYVYVRVVVPNDQAQEEAENAKRLGIEPVSVVKTEHGVKVTYRLSPSLSLVPQADPATTD